MRWSMDRAYSRRLKRWSRTRLVWRIFNPGLPAGARQDDRDVVVAAVLVGQIDECPASGSQVPLVGEDGLQDVPVLDHGGQAVGAQKQQVAGPKILLDQVRLDL